MGLSTQLSAARHSRWLRIVGIVALVAIAVLSLLPGHWQRRTGLPGHFEHFIAYAGTSVVITFTGLERLPVWMPTVALLLYALLMELLQNFVPGRDPALSDAIFSGLGAVVGGVLAVALLRIVGQSD